ncbi:MAG: hypothetical protein QNK36_08885 [Colwellia sp.]|nr:hypothetical protein [Colwellia sp.]
MILILITFLAFAGIIIQALSRKLDEHEKSTRLVWSQYLVMALIVIVSGYAQYDSSKNQKELEIAKLKMSVLSKVSQEYFPVMKNMIDIGNNFLTVRNYLSYKEAQEKHPQFKDQLNWEGVASENHKKELKEVKDSLNEIKQVAAEIIRLNEENNGIIHDVVIEWSVITLRIKLRNLKEYYDTYAPIGEMPEQSVINYHQKTNEAFTIVMKEIKKSVKAIQK